MKEVKESAQVDCAPGFIDIITAESDFIVHLSLHTNGSCAVSHGITCFTSYYNNAIHLFYS